MNLLYKVFIGVLFTIIVANNLIAKPSPSSYISDASVTGIVENGYNVGRWDDKDNWDNGIPDLSNNDVNTISTGDSMIYSGSIAINNKVTINVNGILVFTGSFSAFNNFTINVASGGKFIVSGSMSVNNNSNATINGNVNIGGDLTVGGGSTTWEGTGTIIIGGTDCGQIPGPFDSDANCYDSNSPLPVSLKDFIVSLNTESQAELSWTTLTEEDNDYFEIQRSLDAVNFETIGRVGGNGTTNSIINYTFTDESPLSGISYYKLKQVDYDGVSTYYSVIALINNSKKETFYLYPNPTNGIQYFQLDEGVELYQLYLTTMEGNRMDLYQEQSAIETKEIYYYGLSEGIYILHAITSSGTIRSRVSLK